MCLAKAQRDVKPARLVSEEIEVAGTRVATRQITSTTKRMQRRKSSGGDLPESHTVRGPDDVALDRVHEDDPTWATSQLRWRSFDLVWRIVDKTIYKTRTWPWHLERTIAANIDDRRLLRGRAAVDRRSE